MKTIRFILTYAILLLSVETMGASGADGDYKFDPEDYARFTSNKWLTIEEEERSKRRDSDKTSEGILSFDKSIEPLEKLLEEEEEVKGATREEVVSLARSVLSLHESVSMLMGYAVLHYDLLPRFDSSTVEAFNSRLRGGLNAIFMKGRLDLRKKEKSLLTLGIEKGTEKIFLKGLGCIPVVGKPAEELGKLLWSKILKEKIFGDGKISYHFFTTNAEVDMFSILVSRMITSIYEPTIKELKEGEREIFLDGITYSLGRWLDEYGTSKKRYLTPDNFVSGVGLFCATPKGHHATKYWRNSTVVVPYEGNAWYKKRRRLTSLDIQIGSKIYVKRSDGYDMYASDSGVITKSSFVKSWFNKGRVYIAAPDKRPVRIGNEIWKEHPWVYRIATEEYVNSLVFLGKPIFKRIKEKVDLPAPRKSKK